MVQDSDIFVRELSVKKRKETLAYGNSEQTKQNTEELKAKFIIFAKMEW